jgi:hypothetical protein
VINPTLESVTQAKVTTQNYDAEFGQALAVGCAAEVLSIHLYNAELSIKLPWQHAQAENPQGGIQIMGVYGLVCPSTHTDIGASCLRKYFRHDHG